MAKNPHVVYITLLLTISVSFMYTITRNKMAKIILIILAILGAVLGFLLLIGLLFPTKKLLISVNVKPEVSVGETVPVEYTITNPEDKTYEANEYIVELAINSDKEAVTSNPIGQERKIIPPKVSVSGKFDWKVETRYLTKEEGQFYLVVSFSKYNESEKSGVTIASGTVPVSVLNKLKNLSGSIQLSKTSKLTFGDMVTISYSINNDSTMNLGEDGAMVELGERYDQNTFSLITKIDKTTKSGETLSGQYVWKISSIPSNFDHDVVLRISNGNPKDYVVYKEFPQRITYQ